MKNVKIDGEMAVILLVVLGLFVMLVTVVFTDMRWRDQARDLPIEVTCE